jgi:ABC-type spermidine/putrescine transport system permease subunit I
LLAVPYLLLVPAIAFMVFLLLATAFLLRYSFNTWAPDTGMASSWSLFSYVQMFSEPLYYSGLIRSFRVAFIVTIVNLLLAYPIAYIMTFRPRYRNLFLILIIAPLMIDVVLRAYGWLILLSGSGLINSVLIALGLVNTPVKLIFTEWAVVAELLHETLAFMVLPIAAVLQKIDPSLHEAAASLGAGRWRTFWLITLPLSLPGVLAGTLLVFALGTSAFVGPLILGGGNVVMMSTLIRTQMGVTLDWPLGSAMSIVLVTLTLVLLFFYGRSLRAGTGSYQATAGVRR